MERCTIAVFRRLRGRITAPLALLAAGAVAGCSANHLSALPAPPPPQEQPQQSVSAQYPSTQRGLQVVRGHISPEMLRAPLVGKLPLRQRLDLAIGLPLRDRDAVSTLAAGVSDPHSPNYRRYLSAAEFQSRFAPTTRDYDSLIGFAKASGLSVTRTYPGRVVLDVEGTVDAVQRAFHVTIQTRRRPDGSLFYAPDKEPAIALRTPVLHVAGLDDQYVPRPTIASARPIESRLRGKGRTFGPGGAFAGSDFRNAYAPNVAQTGVGQCVGLLEFKSSFFPSDVSAYQTEFNLPPLAPQTILLDGYNGQPVVGSGERETALDIEVAQAMAPGLGNILVYEGSHADSIFAAMTSGQLCDQLSASWEFKVDSTAQQLVDQMALQGQSFFVSSGDEGGFTNDTKDDRDLSNTVVVGGTELTLNPASGQWQSETAWPNSGGGVEKSQYDPTFQRGVKLVRGSTPHKRMVPDVAMVADNVFAIVDNGQQLIFAGTSISSPLWAAYVSLVNQLALATGEPLLGFPDPPLYALAADTALYPHVFHDITSGSNGPFVALPRYDMVTGWGSPQSALITALNPSPTFNFTQLQIVVFTGSDDLRPDSDLQAGFKGIENLAPFCLMRSNNGKPSGACTGNVYGDTNGLQGWPAWSTQTLTYDNRFANWIWK